jgi:hypothetical protein
LMMFAYQSRDAADKCRHAAVALGTMMPEQACTFRARASVSSRIFRLQGGHS